MLTFSRKSDTSPESFDGKFSKSPEAQELVASGCGQLNLLPERVGAMPENPSATPDPQVISSRRKSSFLAHRVLWVAPAPLSQQFWLTLMRVVQNAEPPLPPPPLLPPRTAEAQGKLTTA